MISKIIKNTLLALLNVHLFIIPLIINGQTVFEAELIYDKHKEQLEITDTKSADLDGDGDKDIISSSNGGDRIVWYENINGKGNFSSQKYIEGSHGYAYPVKIITADFDGDGDIDIISASLSYIVLHINSNNKFESSIKVYGDLQNYLVNPMLVDVFDFDNDGDIDIIHRTTLYENKGGNNFKPTSIEIGGLLNGQKVIHLLPVNLDKDEDVEFLIATQKENTYTVAIFDKVNSSKFYNVIKTLVTTSERIVSITVSDIYPDSYIDICYTTSKNFDHYWVKNLDNNLNFEKSKELSIHDGAIHDVFFYDMNKDGSNDLIGDRGHGFGIMWMKNDGKGNFIDNNAGDNSVFLDRIITGDLSTVEIADINDDGLIDFIVSSKNDNLLGWYENKGNEEFSKMKILSKKNNIAFGFEVLDIDKDGDIDTFNGPVGNNIYLHENINGKLAKHQIEVGEFDRSPMFRISDLNNDQNPDIICKMNPTEVVWLRKKENELKYSVKEPMINDYLEYFTLADIDKDNLIDLVTDQGWYKNINKGESFKKQQSLLPQDGLDVFKIFVSDIDSDNDLDIIVGSSNGKVNDSTSKNLIGYYENTDGKGTFSNLKIISELTQEESINDFDIGDIDNDNDDDIVITNKPGVITVLENKEGVFSTSTEIANEIASTVYFIDIDNDNKKDLLVDNSIRLKKTLWYKNKGDKTFEEIGITIKLSNNKSHNGIQTIADINKDGSTDILFRQLGHNFLQYNWAKNLNGSILSVDTDEEELLKSNTIVYPNPAEGYFEIKSNQVYKKLEIYNNLGQKLKTITKKQGEISLKNFQRGLYLLKIYFKNNIIIEKKIIRK